VAGHLAGAFLFYAVHRWIFHGSKRNPIVKFFFTMPGLRYLAEKGRATHGAHHRETFRKSVEEEVVKDNLFFPLWGKLVIAGITSVFAMISLPFAVGVCSFFPVYAYRHNAAHQGSEKPYAKHHLYHHHVDARVNHGGIYLIYDKLFGTYKS